MSSEADLTPKQEEQLRDALVSAFSRNELEQILRFDLNGKDLNSITTANSNKLDQFFEVVKAARMAGWTDELIKAAYEKKPRNSELRKFVELNRPEMLIEHSEDSPRSNLNNERPENGPGGDVHPERNGTIFGFPVNVRTIGGIAVFLLTVVLGGYGIYYFATRQPDIQPPPDAANPTSRPSSEEDGDSDREIAPVTLTTTQPITTPVTPIVTPMVTLADTTEPLPLSLDEWEVSAKPTACAINNPTIGYYHVTSKDVTGATTNSQDDLTEFWFQSTKVSIQHYLAFCEVIYGTKETEDCPFFNEIEDEDTFWDDPNQQQDPVLVTDDNAVAYAKWVEGRLPTQMEWNIACGFHREDNIGGFTVAHNAKITTTEYTDRRKNGDNSSRLIVGEECGQSRSRAALSPEEAKSTGFRVVLDSCPATIAVSPPIAEITVVPRATPQPTRCYIGSTQPLAVATSSAYNLSNAAVAINSQPITSSTYLLSGAVRQVTVPEPSKSNSYRLIPGFWCSKAEEAQP
ncbi:MAG: effector-associated domain EAD1-containing protein [Chloroflexota bacterium]